MKDNLRNEYIWMLSVRNNFTFTGGKLRFQEKGNSILHSSVGVSGFAAYHRNESEGKTPPTKHPNILRTLFTVKASLNFQIKEWAQDRASGLLPQVEFKKIIEELRLPEWVVKAVENQKVNYYTLKNTV